MSQYDVTRRMRRVGRSIEVCIDIHKLLIPQEVLRQARPAA